ncbi:MAG: PF20097 family protein [Lachnospiraceae bacterium]|nr:PF20097 family protein [Lachnospiraceae bacterium]
MICPNCGKTMAQGYVPLHRRRIMWLPENTWFENFKKGTTMFGFSPFFNKNRIIEESGGIFLTGDSEGTGYNDKYEALDSNDPTASFKSYICKDCNLCLIDYSTFMTK